VKSLSETEALFDPEVVEDPYGYFAELREHDPVHLVEGTDTFLVTRMDLIHQVVGDTATFSSNSNAFLALGADGRPCLLDALGDAPALEIDGMAIIATADPPVHSRQRKVLTGLFSRRSIDGREAELCSLVDAILDPFLDAGRLEWMSDVAEEVPALVIARILGVPDTAAGFLKETGFATVEQIGGFATEDRRGELRDLMTRLGPLGEEYERVRGGGGVAPDTVLAVCVAAVEAGELDDLEAIATLMLIVAAGTESTTSMLGAGARILADDHALQHQLRAEPDLIGNFVEEVCRLDPPFRGHYRRVTVDTTLGGTPVPAGSRVVLVWPAANRDPAAYEDALDLRLDRTAPRQHVGFGWGIHLCLGAPLARLEGRVVFDRLLARTRSVTLESSDVRHHRSLMIRRLLELPLRVEPC
jgi:cytochrome P450